MSAALVPLGGGLVALAMVEVTWTTLAAGSGAGPVSARCGRAVWSAALAAPVRQRPPSPGSPTPSSSSATAWLPMPVRTERRWSRSRLRSAPSSTRSAAHSSARTRRSPAPALGPLQRAGVPTADDAAYDHAVAAARQRRRLLAAFLRNDGWTISQSSIRTNDQDRQALIRPVAEEGE